MLIRLFGVDLLYRLSASNALDSAHATPLGS